MCVFVSACGWGRKKKSCSFRCFPWIVYKINVLAFFPSQSHLTLWNPTDCSPPGSSVHGILQARILECVAIPFSRGSSQPRDRTQVCCTADRFFTVSATRETSKKGCANFLKMYDPWIAILYYTQQLHINDTHIHRLLLIHSEFWHCKFKVQILCTCHQSSDKCQGKISRSLIQKVENWKH